MSDEEFPASETREDTPQSMSIWDRAANSLADDIVRRMCALEQANEVAGVTHANIVKVAAAIDEFYRIGAVAADEPKRIRAVS